MQEEANSNICHIQVKRNKERTLQKPFHEQPSFHQRVPGSKYAILSQSYNPMNINTLHKTHIPCIPIAPSLRRNQETFTP